MHNTEGPYLTSVTAAWQIPNLLDGVQFLGGVQIEEQGLFFFIYRSTLTFVGVFLFDDKAAIIIV